MAEMIHVHLSDNAKQGLEDRYSIIMEKKIHGAFPLSLRIASLETTIAEKTAGNFVIKYSSNEALNQCFREWKDHPIKKLEHKLEELKTEFDKLVANTNR